MVVTLEYWKLIFSMISLIIRSVMAPKTLVKKTSIYPLMNPRERLPIWEKARGMWKRRKPDPAKELKKMRKEWARKLSHTDK
jgi:hypothetical protein